MHLYMLWYTEILSDLKHKQPTEQWCIFLKNEKSGALDFSKIKNKQATSEDITPSHLCPEFSRIQY